MPQPTDNRLHFLPVPADVYRNIALGLQRAIVTADPVNVMLVGDQMVFREIDAKRALAGETVLSGNWIARRITDRVESVPGSGLQPGFALFSFNTPAENESAATRLRREVWLWERRGVPAPHYFEMLAAAHAETRPSSVESA